MIQGKGDRGRVKKELLKKIKEAKQGDIIDCRISRVYLYRLDDAGKIADTIRIEKSEGSTVTKIKVVKKAK